MRAFPPSPTALLGTIDGTGEPGATARALLILALDLPPRRSRRRTGGSARRVARRKRASFSSGQGRAVEKPHRPGANPAQPGAIFGSPSLWLLSLGDQEKVTRPPPRRTKP